MSKRTETRSKVMGYLPNDVPPFGQIVLLGFQHALTMFPATVLVALLVGFHTSTVLLASGLATIDRPARLALWDWQVHPAVLRLLVQLHCRDSGRDQRFVRTAGER